MKEPKMKTKYFFFINKAWDPLKLKNYSQQNGNVKWCVKEKVVRKEDYVDKEKRWLTFNLKGQDWSVPGSTK